MSTREPGDFAKLYDVQGAALQLFDALRHISPTAEHLTVTLDRETFKALECIGNAFLAQHGLPATSTPAAAAEALTINGITFRKAPLPPGHDEELQAMAERLSEHRGRVGL